MYNDPKTVELTVVLQNLNLSNGPGSERAAAEI
jgi:hypothetical protein